MSERGISAEISIHDVMPSTVNDVSSVISLLESHGIKAVQLLVVPGLDWKASDIATLKHWENRGYELVGHGWRHRASEIRGIFHHAHSLLLSRDAAEHLSLDSTAIASLLDRCYGWFGEHGFSHPRRYVPPAWALGPISRLELYELKFKTYELLSGDLDPRTGRVRRLPLVGFEADSWARSIALRAWNTFNRLLAHLTGRPLRIAIHPKDLDLRMSGDLRALITEVVRG